MWFASLMLLLILVLAIVFLYYFMLRLQHLSLLQLLMPLMHTNTHKFMHIYALAHTQIQRNYHYDTTSKNLLSKDNYMISNNLTSRFTHINIHPRRDGSLAFDGMASTIYVYNVLPFGVRSAPYAFAKTVSVLVARLRQAGIKDSPYLDDFLFSRHLEADIFSPLLCWKSIYAEQVFWSISRKV
jgi:hypothetical protein